VVKVILQQAASPPHMDGSRVFARWRTPMHVHMHFFRPTRVQIPNGTLINLAVYGQLTAKYHYTLQWAALSPLKFPLPMWGSGPHQICGSLGPSKSSTQMASRSIQPSLQG